MSCIIIVAPNLYYSWILRYRGVSGMTYNNIWEPNLYYSWIWKCRRGEWDEWI